MNTIYLRKLVRKFAAKIGVLYWLRKIVFYFRRYQWPEIDRRFVSRFIGPDDLIFDVGANRGQSSECYISLGARVVAFEPQHDLHAEIRQVCGRSPKLTIDSSGLGSCIETRKLFITEYDQVASLRPDWQEIHIGEVYVSVSTLDLKIAQYGLPRYCKIDVEGWELEVISGLSHPLDIISFEYHLSDGGISAANAVLQKLFLLGKYWCNIRESSGKDFLLPNFQKITNFMDCFPNKLGVPLKDGYGDIFLFLDPTRIRQHAY